MIGALHTNRRIEFLNTSTVADDVIFALGDFIKEREVEEDKIDMGIELCEGILRGVKIEPEKIKIEEMPDYERYKIIENSSAELKHKGFEIDRLPEKTQEIRSVLNKIKMKQVVPNEKIIETQQFFLTISMPFWNQKISSFRQRKTNRGLHVND